LSAANVSQNVRAPSSVKSLASAIVALRMDTSVKIDSSYDRTVSLNLALA